ncbi:DUF1467 family protein [bacterium]|nr:DUF1467 family protein [bacterium]
MSVFGVVMVFLVSWWVVFLPILSLGNRSQVEDGVVAPGSERGAPVDPRLARKALYTTAAAALITLLLWGVLTFNLLPTPE